MSIAVEWIRNNQPVQMWHGQPGAGLPVRWRNGAIRTVAWCDPTAPAVQSGNTAENHTTWPDGGWTQLDAILAGEWQVYSPREVKICVSRFGVVDRTSTTHWIPLQPGQYLQGVIATLGQSERVYIVTVPPPPYMEINVSVWPRVIETG